MIQVAGTGTGHLNAAGSLAVFPSAPIWNTTAPPDADLPNVVFTLASTSHQQYLGRSAGVATTQVQFQVAANTQNECAIHGNNLKRKLGGFVGLMGLTDIYSCQLVSEIDDIEKDDRHDYRTKTITYELLYAEPKPFVQFTAGLTLGEFEESLASYLSPLGNIYNRQLPPNMTPQGAIVFRQSDGSDTNYLRAFAYYNREYEFTIIAPNKAIAYAKAIELRNRLDGYYGLMQNANILECVLDDESESVEFTIGDKPVSLISQVYQFIISAAQS